MLPFKRTGVWRYVCFGGRAGRYDGRERNDAGMIGWTPSSSDPRSSGDGERDFGGTKIGASTISRASARFQSDRMFVDTKRAERERTPFLPVDSGLDSTQL